MGAAPTPPELEVEFEHVAEMRQADRRGKQRRLLRMQLDPLFAVTLMSQIETAPIKNSTAYAAPRRRCGKYVNLRA